MGDNGKKTQNPKVVLVRKAIAVLTVLGALFSAINGWVEARTAAAEAALAAKDANDAGSLATHVATNGESEIVYEALSTAIRGLQSQTAERQRQIDRLRAEVAQLRAHHYAGPPEHVAWGAGGSGVSAMRVESDDMPDSECATDEDCGMGQVCDDGICETIAAETTAPKKPEKKPEKKPSATAKKLPKKFGDLPRVKAGRKRAAELIQQIQGPPPNLPAPGGAGH